MSSIFTPPLSLGGYKPTPGTLSEFVYQVWAYLNSNPIPDDSDISEEVKKYIEENPEFSSTIAEIVDEYIAENPPESPVESVQGKTGVVVLNYQDIVSSDNPIPVYVNASNPSQQSLVTLYTYGYRFFYNSTTALLYVVSRLGELSSVGSPVSVTSVNGSTGAVQLGGNDIPVDDQETNWGDMTITEVLNSLFHVGFTIITKALPSVWNPNNYYPGTWSLIENAFIYGASADTESISDTIQGAATHTLTAEQLPRITGSFTVRGYQTSGGNAGNIAIGGNGVISTEVQSAASASIRAADGGTNQVPTKIQLAFGNGAAHNNMPPYLKRFIWERVE